MTPVHTAPPAMAEKHAIVISRAWHNPAIAIHVTPADTCGKCGHTGTALEVSMPLDDFTAALLDELGSPASVLTRAQLAQRVTAAVDRVTATMKRATTRVV